MVERKCHKCCKSAESKLVDKWYCRKCFCELVEQKIKHNLRKYNLKKDCRLTVKDKASEYIITKVINLPVRITNKKGDYEVVPWTMDDENEEFLKKFLENKKIKTKEDLKKIKLFCPLSKNDMKTYFSIKKIPYSPEKTELNDMMDKFESKYAGTKNALLRSNERLNEILK